MSERVSGCREGEEGRIGEDRRKKERRECERRETEKRGVKGEKRRRE